MHKTFRALSRLSFSLIFLLCACTSHVKAPVDSRNKTPTAEKQASYSQTNGSIPSAEKNRDFHLVVKGDTLYSIAWRYGYDYRDVARWNDISTSYVIYPGQFIRLKADPEKVKLSKSATVSSKKGKPSASKKASSSKKTTSKANIRKTLKQSRKSITKVKWNWPTTGKLVKLNTPTSKKGVDISGKAGQKIAAAADGDVVYSGSGLLGYGKLIIIKHNDTFLSAYAHNEKLHAGEGDKVKAGQKIATMGLGNKGRPILHFEIRKNGTPVNPLQHLPRKNS